jgi:hypothetical protein
MPTEIEERKALEERFSDLKSVRWKLDKDWEAIAAFFLPYRVRGYRDKSREQLNRYETRDTDKINDTPIEAQKILSAGLMAGITSPSRNWFHLTTADKELREKHAVKVYLNKVEEIIREHLAQGGFYQSLADGVYPDLGTIGTGALLVEEKPFGIHCEPMVPGEFWLDVDHEGKVDTMFRMRPMTAGQIVKQFGIENVSQKVKEAIKAQKHSTTFEVVFCIYPNDEWNPKLADRNGKRWSSRWYELGEKKKFLRRGGYEEFPVMAPRWQSMPGEAYGRGAPGWKVKGDAGGLDFYEQRLLEMIDKITNPPMGGPASIANASLLPGTFTIVEGGKFEPVMAIPPQVLDFIDRHITRTEGRVNRAFYVNLWMALLNDQRVQRPTATEVEATRDEVMLQLGPLLENLNVGLLDPVIERVFQSLNRRGLLPDPPPELQGTEGALKVEFISIMHRAMKMTAIVGLREWIIAIQQLAVLTPAAIDKVDVDVLMDELAEILGIKPDIIVSEEAVEELRRAKAERQQAAEQGEAMLKATEGAENLSGVDPGQIGELAQTMAPVAGAQRAGPI